MTNEIIVQGTQEFMGKEIPVVYGGFGEGQKVVLAKTIAEIHEMKVGNVNQRINDNRSRFKDGIDIIDLKIGYASDALLNLGFNQSQINASNNIYLLSERGYAILVEIMSDKTLEVSEAMFRDYFNCNKYVVVSNRKEIEFIECLEQTLLPFDITQFERQYSKLKCGNYKIDLYLPEINVAIEYDENEHKRYTYEQQELRQKLIEEELGCRFIRVTDKMSHSYNVGKVLKEMFVA